MKTMLRLKQSLKNKVLSFLFLLVYTGIPVLSQEYTLGIGKYPGNPGENFAPTLVAEKKQYHNLAYLRPAYHSSSYDYNLTAQLITDGIRDTREPMYIVTSTSKDGVLKKNEREYLIDHNTVTTVDFNSTSGWMQLELKGGDKLPVVDRIDLFARMRVDNAGPKGWKCTVLGSNDGTHWNELGSARDTVAPGEMKPNQFGRIFNPSISLTKPVSLRFYRVTFEAPSATNWSIGELTFFNQGKISEMEPSNYFTSAWMPAGNTVEWVCVDLGNESSFDRIQLFWIKRASEGVLQVSDDSRTWKEIRSLPQNGALTEEIKLVQPAKGRYVRLLFPNLKGNTPFILSEMEVYGTGGFVAQPKPAPAADAANKLYLSGGNWRIQRSSLVTASGELLSKPGFNDKEWVTATVPATVLMSYWNAGAVPDPNYGDNQLMISESFFNSDFWYRNEFMAPMQLKGGKQWLNFDGINWKADVYLNGKNLGKIEGAFHRGKFDVTGLLLPGQKNVLAVLVHKNATPGCVKEKTYLSPDKNGGALGADNPTFHASVGWDWIPTVRGRNIGIWNDVFISRTGPVTIEDPYISATLPLPDTTFANINVEVTFRNTSNKPVSGNFILTLGPIKLKKRISIDPSSKTTVVFNPSSNNELRMFNPKLWWPQGYGEPYLYNVEMKYVMPDSSVSDRKSFKTGIRQMNYSEDDGNLKIWVNGRRFIGRGGNWGFSESNLAYRQREYDAAVRYHRDMNFTMIRNWVGQTGDDEFFDACDKYGIMIWQDFWLANPWDGPDPDDNHLFLDNVNDFVLKIRNHPSLGLYCGRNEGNPPKELDDQIRIILSALQPQIHYISNSASKVVSGEGPYRALPSKFYFEQRATRKFHSEMGMPNIVNYESLQAMIPDSALWPQGRFWGMHDFCLNGAQGGSSFLERIEKSYGTFTNAKDWTTIAQWVNYEGYRAMFEAQSRNRMGVLLWMSHPTWPSFVWQTYDYYFEPTAAYFGSKKACEPLHIQWNAFTDSIEVVNYSAGNKEGLEAVAELLNLDGAVKWSKTVTLDSKEDSRSVLFKPDKPEGLSSVYFIRLKLSKGNQLLSQNFYWRGTEENNFRELRNLPRVKVECSSQLVKNGNTWIINSNLKNTSDKPALMVRLKAIREKSGDRILPVMYEDNYISLMPGEQRTIRTELLDADTRGEKPKITVEGFNVE